MTFGCRIGDIFGGGKNWLRDVVPGGQEFDLVNGRSNGPAGSFIRTPSKNWIPTGPIGFVEIGPINPGTN